MHDLGYFALILALGLVGYGFATSILAGLTKRKDFLETSERSMLAAFVLITVSISALLVLFLEDKFYVKYVYENSNRALPTPYKVAALWGGMAGSLLFWNWLLALFSFIVVIQNRNKNRDLMPWVLMILSGSVFFFTLTNMFGSNPFTLITVQVGGVTQIASIPDGHGLNPLLQHPAMVIHPPLLYLGYVGYVVPFAFAIAALLTRKKDGGWIKTSRIWSMASWFFLGIGILLGANWAYVELGWGGYWAWDPVENASLMPWITGTAFLHSALATERKGMLKVWTVSLIIVTYMLCVFGTYLTRSGIVASVHAFADSTIGNYFIIYMVIALIVSLYLVITRLPYLRSEKKIDSMVSKEGAFLFSNLVFVLSCLAVFWGTLFPTISEAFTGERITVGPPWFNRVEVPIWLFLMFLTGVGPLLAWRKTSVKNLKKNFIVPGVITFIFAIVLYIAGIRQPAPLICFAFSLFVIQTIIMEFSRGVKARQRAFGESGGTAFINMLERNSRRWGAYTVHFGMVLMFIGLSGAAFTIEKQISVGVGDRFELGKYTLQSDDVRQFKNENYEGAVIPMTIFNGDREIGKIYPERRYYFTSEQLTSEVAIKSSLKEDIYVVLNGFTDDGKVLIRAFINPLVVWIWIGGLLIGFGVVITLIPERKELLVPESRPEMIPADAK